MHHNHQDDHGHAHVHVASDPALLRTREGMRAVLISLAGLAATALVQAVVVTFSGSVALLADMIHNVGDAATAIPLWIAFACAHRTPTKRFTYGFGRLEDLAGLITLALIAASAAVAGWQSIARLLHPKPPEHLWFVAAAALVGFAGNELVARYRIRAGNAIHSAALVADGHHARADALTSLAVLLGVAGTWAGLRIADPLVGMAITLGILRILYAASITVLTHVLDGVEPGTVERITSTASDVPGIHSVRDVRVRWTGHQMEADIVIFLPGSFSAAQTEATLARTRDALHLAFPSLAHVRLEPQFQGDL